MQLLHWFFASIELLALAGVDSLVLVGRKIDRGKIRSSLVVVRDCCSLPVRAQCCRTVSSSVHWKLVSYRFLVLVRWQCKIVARFSEVFCKCSNALYGSVKPGSEIKENGLLSGSEREGNDQLRLSEAFRLWTIVNWQCAIFLPRRRANLFRKTFSSSFIISTIRFKNLVPLGVASYSVTFR